MDERIETYDVCLPDWGAILPELATLLSAKYADGMFESAEDTFCASGLDRSEWSLVGSCGSSVAVIFEKYEGYFSGTIQGSGTLFTNAKLFLYRSYIAQGGNPDAQAKP